MIFKIFTWNLQKGRTVAPFGNIHETNEAKDRLELLYKLCLDSHLGFITEPGKDFRAACTDPRNNGLNKLPAGFIWRDLGNDNQSETGACRPLLYSKENSEQQIQTGVYSGKLDAYRYPCGQIIKINNSYILAVSLHSTSGDSGKANTKAIIADFKRYIVKNGIGGLMIGGDFNAHIDEVGYNMPKTPTNQGAGHNGMGIDGFYFFTNNNSNRPVGFAYQQAEPLHKLDPGQYKLELAAGGGHGALNKHGFFRKVTRNMQNYWVRQSDHSPVCSCVTVTAS